MHVNIKVLASAFYQLVSSTFAKSIFASFFTTLYYHFFQIDFVTKYKNIEILKTSIAIKD